MDAESGVPAAGTCCQTGDAGTRADKPRRGRYQHQNGLRRRWIPPAVEPRPATAATRKPTSAGIREEPRVTLAEWPGFRGPGRDGVVRAVTVATNWEASPPVEMWRRPVGPGWSSFAVHGEIGSTHRNSAATRRSLRPTTCAPAGQSGSIATPRGSGRRSAEPVRAGRRR